MTLLVSTLTLALVLLGYSLFLSLRQPAQTRVEFAPFVTNTTLAPVVLNTTDACLRACHTTTCTVTTGSVRCSTCPSGRVLAGGVCVEDPACGQWPWCTHDEAVRGIDVHNALVWAAVELPVYPYPTTATANMTRSSNYTTVLAPIGAHRSIELLNLYLGAGQLRVLPTNWFDDEKGWWGTSLTAYQATLRYNAYVTALKSTLCNKRWQLTSGECAPPV